MEDTKKAERNIQDDSGHFETITKSSKVRNNTLRKKIIEVTKSVEPFDLTIYGGHELLNNWFSIRRY